jgi:protein-disulfide isomerase
MIKNIFLTIFLFFSINLNAATAKATAPAKKVEVQEKKKQSDNNVVSNKLGIKLQSEKGIITSEDLKGKFSFIWYYDVNCPHCQNSMKPIKEVIDYITNNYADDFNIIFASVVPRDFNSLNNFLEDNNVLYDVISTRVPTADQNDYMNVEATPTLIIIDPYMTIVDKIEGVVVPGIYTRHLDYIVDKFYQYHK